MTRKTTDVGGHTARSNKGIARLNNVYQTDTVQAQLEAAALAAARLGRARKMAFSADPTVPAALPGYFAPTDPEYVVEGLEKSGEWMVADLDSIALTEEWR